MCFGTMFRARVTCEQDMEVYLGVARWLLRSARLQ